MFSLTTFLIAFSNGCLSLPAIPFDSTNSSNPINVAIVSKMEPQIVEIGYNNEMNEKINAIP